MIASESNGYRPGRACVAAHRTGIWACQGHDPLFLWLRWVEVSPKRFSLHARYSFYPSKYAASPQVTKVCVPLFLFSRRNKGDPNAEYNGSHAEFLSQGIEDGTPMRYVPCLLRHCIAAERQLSVSDHTRLNPRPSSPGYQHFRPSGQSLGYRSQ